MVAVVVVAQIGVSSVELRDPLYAARVSRLRTRLAGLNDAELVVAVGSSRIQNGLLGQPLEARLQSALGRRVVVFNFGQGGGGPLTELLILRRLRRDGIRPSIVLIELMVPLLADNGGRPVEVQWLSPAQLSWAERRALAPSGWPQLGFERQWWLDLFLPAYTRRKPLLARVAPRWFAPRTADADVPWVDDSGTVAGMPRAAVTDDERRAGIERMRQEFGWLRDLRLGPQAGRAFRELLELCSAQGLPIAMVLMPEASEFREKYSRDGLSEIRRFADAVGLEHGAMVIDSREWIDDRDFIDTHHLLAGGAAAFTDRLGQSLEHTLRR